MENVDAYIARRDRWLLTTLTLCLFLTGLGMALSPHLGWFFTAAPIEGGARVLMGAGHLVMLFGTIVYAVITGRRAGIARGEIAEMCMLVLICMFSVIHYSVLILPVSIVPGLGAVTAVLTGYLFCRRSWGPGTPAAT